MRQKPYALLAASAISDAVMAANGGLRGSRQACQASKSAPLTTACRAVKSSGPPRSAIWVRGRTGISATPV